MQTHLLKMKMTALNMQIQLVIRTASSDAVEFGRLKKKVDAWGIRQDNTIVWTYELFFLEPEPLNYIIVYDIEKRQFFCLLHLDPDNNLQDLLNFHCKDFPILSSRLLALTKNIPSIRTRVLREYIFSQANIPLIKSTFRFSKAKKMHLYNRITRIISLLAIKKIISQGEVKMMEKYTKELQLY